MRRTNHIPTTKNHAYEEAFWDAHDPTPEEAFRPVKVRLAKKLSHGFMVWLDKETFSTLIHQAYGQHIAPTVLVRDWVLARLQKQKEKTDNHQKELGLGERGWET